MGDEAGRVWILITPDRCSGCRLCEVACSLEHEGMIWPEASRIRIYELFPGVNVPHTCVQCPDYPCVESCNFDALSVEEVTGAVLVNEEKCTECGACVLACPGNVPRIPAGKGSVVICDLCGGAAQVRRGLPRGRPRCTDSREGQLPLGIQDIREGPGREEH